MSARLLVARGWSFFGGAWCISAILFFWLRDSFTEGALALILAGQAFERARQLRREDAERRNP